MAKENTETPETLGDFDAPSPEDIAQAQPEPFSITKEQWEERERRLQEAEERATRLEQRRSDTEASFQEAHRARLHAEATVREFQRMQQERDQAAAQAERLRIPEVDWERAAEDPNVLRQAIEARDQVWDQRLNAYVTPAFQMAQQAKNEAEALRGASVSVLMTQVEKDWQESGYAPEVFKEIRGEMQDYLQSRPEALQEALRGDNGPMLALWFARQKRLQPVRPQSTQPVTTDATPSASPGGAIPSEIRAMSRRVAQRFGLEGEDAAAVTDDNFLREVAKENWGL